MWGLVLAMMLAGRVLAAANGAEGGGHHPVAARQAAVFATVGDDVISAANFQVNLEAAYRQRFFHGKVPREQALAFRRQVADHLVEHLLLYREAQRRGVKADEDWVKQQVQKTAVRYRQLPQWREQREQIMKQLRQRLQEQSLIKQLHRTVEALPTPSEAAVRQYYQAHPQQFTTPERLHLSMILLKVMPWAAEARWQAAGEQARQLVKQLAGGADFASLAQEHSADASAAKGGDLGYIHQGMLSAEAQRVVDRLQPAAVSEPVRLLQGYAVFRLEERVPPQLNAFEHVRSRARRLLLRERKAQAWRALIDQLRNNTPISMNKALLEVQR